MIDLCLELDSANGNKSTAGTCASIYLLITILLLTFIGTVKETSDKGSGLKRKLLKVYIASP